MVRFGAIAAALIFVAACARLPVIDPVPGQPTPTIVEGCQRPFAAGVWQYVHAISSEGGGRFNRLIGVTVIDTESRTADAALMTIEGLLVFGARWDGRLSVSRALPPFDKRPLAEGLMADIRLLFFPPAGLPAVTGRTTDSLAACRYAEADRVTVDVLVDTHGGWEIHRYDAHNRLTRSVRTHGLTLIPGAKAPLARKIELTATGRNGYRLALELISAEAIARGDLAEKRGKTEAN